MLKHNLLGCWSNHGDRKRLRLKTRMVGIPISEPRDVRTFAPRRWLATARGEVRCDFSPVSGFLGRVQLARCGDWRLVVVQNALRPPQRQIIAFDGQSLLFPSCAREEADSLLRALNITDLDDAVVFHQAVTCDYGVLDKGCAPIIIHDSAIASECGIESLSEYTGSLNEGQMLCWQKWGGFLYSFRIDFSATSPFVSWERIAVAVGNFRRLPTRLFR